MQMKFGQNDAMDSELHKRVAAVAADLQSGASAILAEVVAILRAGLERGAAIHPIALKLCRAQPSMAPVWNAAIEALAPNGAQRLERFAERARRAPAAIARFALESLATDAPASQRGALRVVTLSYSGTVAWALESLHATGPLHVACSESRPGLEGRRLAARLAAGDIQVMCFSDAAIAHALAGAHAVILGADAVSPDWFLNKSGSRMLTAAAAQLGLPVYVLASRDKFASRDLAVHLTNRDGGASEIWPDAPDGVIVANPYFEQTPLDLITAVISDLGVLGAALVPDACTAVHDATALESLRALTGN
jgi:translation initiation factor 2B subunit (eIF-2B alpha/beta/delta family)